MTIKEAILDSLCDDYESLTQIYNYLVYLGIKTDISEIKNKIEELIIEGLIFIEKSLSNEEDGEWYGMTTEGEKAWKNIIS